MQKNLDLSIENGVVTVNGEEVSNPFAKVAVRLLAAVLGILIALVSVFLVLPFLGVVVTLGLGVAVALAIAVAVTLILLAFAGPSLLAFLVLIGVLG